VLSAIKTLFLRPSPFLQESRLSSRGVKDVLRDPECPSLKAFTVFSATKTPFLRPSPFIRESRLSSPEVKAVLSAINSD
jgi:hypothetical protein